MTIKDTLSQMHNEQNGHDLPGWDTKLITDKIFGDLGPDKDGRPRPKISPAGMDLDFVMFDTQLQCHVLFEFVIIQPEFCVQKERPFTPWKTHINSYWKRSGMKYYKGYQMMRNLKGLYYVVALAKYKTTPQNDYHPYVNQVKFIDVIDMDRSGIKKQITCYTDWENFTEWIRRYSLFTQLYFDKMNSNAGFENIAYRQDTELRRAPPNPIDMKNWTPSEPAGVEAYLMTDQDPSKGMLLCPKCMKRVHKLTDFHVCDKMASPYAREFVAKKSEKQLAVNQFGGEM